MIYQQPQTTWNQHKPAWPSMKSLSFSFEKGTKYPLFTLSFGFLRPFRVAHIVQIVAVLKPNTYICQIWSFLIHAFKNTCKYLVLKMYLWIQGSMATRGFRSQHLVKTSDLYSDSIFSVWIDSIVVVVVVVMVMVINLSADIEWVMSVSSFCVDNYGKYISVRVQYLAALIPVYQRY